MSMKLEQKTRDASGAVVPIRVWKVFVTKEIQ